MPRAKTEQSMNSDTDCFQYGNLSHDDIRKAFVHVINIVEPDHPYHNSPYPVTEKQIEYSYKKSSGPYYASCGPRMSNSVVSFSADLNSFNKKSPERILAILAHEITHVTVGRHSNVESGSHPPRFWREFAFYAHIMLDNWDEIENVFGPVDPVDFIGHIVSKEVNRFNIDRRYGTVMFRRHEMAMWFKNTAKRLKKEYNTTS